MLKAIRQKAPLYSNAVTYLQLIHYYAAQKIAQMLKASIQVNFINDDEQQTSVIIPVMEEWLLLRPEAIRQRLDVITALSRKRRIDKINVTRSWNLNPPNVDNDKKKLNSRF